MFSGIPKTRGEEDISSNEIGGWDDFLLFLLLGYAHLV